MPRLHGESFSLLRPSHPAGSISLTNRHFRHSNLSVPLHSGLSAIANLQQETAATNTPPSGSGCAYSRLARHERRSTRPAPPLCKQGVRWSGLKSWKAVIRNRTWDAGRATVGPHVAAICGLLRSLRVRVAGVCSMAPTGRGILPSWPCEFDSRHPLHHSKAHCTREFVRGALSVHRSRSPDRAVSVLLGTKRSVGDF